jgi:hypothetical protein
MLFTTNIPRGLMLWYMPPSNARIPINICIASPFYVRFDALHFYCRGCQTAQYQRAMEGELDASDNAGTAEVVREGEGDAATCGAADGAEPADEIPVF